MDSSSSGESSESLRIDEVDFFFADETPNSASTSKTEGDQIKNERFKEELREAIREKQILKDMISRAEEDCNALQMKLNQFIRHPPSFHGQETETLMAPNPSINLNSASMTLSVGKEVSESPASNGKYQNLRQGSFVGDQRRPIDAPFLNRRMPQEQLPEASMRKTRVCMRARSEAPMIGDGCKWKKYGQKNVKGNRYPRGYYRCIMSSECPVRKKVQKCAEDTSVLNTTYEGTHNHPLPPDAVAMASTTTAAATMRPSGSMPSISSTYLFPTVTLDLTQYPPSTQPQFLRPFEPLPSIGAAPAAPQIFGRQLRSEATAPVMLNETVATAPTSDPNFNTVVAATVSSIVGSQITPEE